MTKRFPRILLPRDEAERAETIMRALDHAPDILVIEDATEGMPFTAACRAAFQPVARALVPKARSPPAPSYL